MVAHRSALLGRWFVPAMARLALPMTAFFGAVRGLSVVLPSRLLLAPSCPRIAGCRRLAALLSRWLALIAVPA
jgi:hypothetical protein